MAGLRKVMEKISSTEKANKGTQTRRSIWCHNCSQWKKDSLEEISLSPTATTRGHIYEDPRHSRATGDVEIGIAKQTQTMMMEV